MPCADPFLSNVSSNCVIENGHDPQQDCGSRADLDRPGLLAMVPPASGTRSTCLVPPQRVAFCPSVAGTAGSPRSRLYCLYCQYRRVLCHGPLAGATCGLPPPELPIQCPHPSLVLEWARRPKTGVRVVCRLVYIHVLGIPVIRSAHSTSNTPRALFRVHRLNIVTTLAASARQGKASSGGIDVQDCGKPKMR